MSPTFSAHLCHQHGCHQHEKWLKSKIVDSGIDTKRPSKESIDLHSHVFDDEYQTDLDTTKLFESMAGNGLIFSEPHLGSKMRV